MVITKTSVDSKRERDILSHSIANTEFLKSMVTVCKEQYLVSPHSRMVWRWCAEYFAQYSKAPGKDIQDIYIMHRSGMKADDADNVGTMLANLSDDFMEVSNIQYLIKVSIDYLRERSLDVHIEAIKQCKDRKDLVEAEKLIAEYGRVKLIDSSSSHIFDNPAEVAATFSTNEAELFRFPNAFGRLVGPVKESDLILVSARKGVGKSWILQKFAVQGMLAERKVLFISLEMEESHVRRRIYSQLMAKGKETKDIEIPYFYKDTEDFDEKWKVGFEQHHLDKYEPTVEEVEEFITQFKKYYPKTDLRIMAIPAKSITVSDLRREIDNLEYYENFIPQLICIDYPTLLRFENNKDEHRVSLGNVWTELRGICLQKNVCIVGAAQINRAGGSLARVSDLNLADSDGIVDSCTTAIGMVATPMERSKGLARASQMKERDNGTIADEVVLLSCLDLGHFGYDSRFLSEVEYSFNKELDKEKKFE